MVVSTDWTSIASRLWSQRRDTLLKDTVTCECPSSVPAPWRGQVATKAKPGLTQRHAEERRGKELSASLCESLRLCVKSSQARGRPALGRERRGRRCRRGCSGRRCPHQGSSGITRGFFIGWFEGTGKKAKEFIGWNPGWAKPGQGGAT